MHKSALQWHINIEIYWWAVTRSHICNLLLNSFFDFKVNEWMKHLYSALLCIVVHPKRFTIIWGGLSSTTTSVQHPLGWCDGSHRTTAPVRSPHTSYIYAFSRRFYPKRLTLHSSYSFYILSALAFPGNRTHDLGVVSTMLYHLSYRKATDGEEREIEPIKWMGIIGRPWLTRASGGNLARTPGLHPYSLRWVS